MKPIKILFFTSPNCSICDSQDRILKDFANTGAISYENHLITTDFDMALRFGVKSSPTLVFMGEDRPLNVSPGFQSRTAIAGILNLIQNG